MAKVVQRLMVIVICCVTIDTQLMAQSNSGTQSLRRKEILAAQKMPTNSLPASHSHAVSSRRVTLAPSDDINAIDAVKFKFVDSENFLKTKPVKFAEADKFLKEPDSAWPPRSTATIQPFNSGQSTSANSPPLPQGSPPPDASSINFTDQLPEVASKQIPNDDEDDRHLSVSDVYAPIGLNPFGDIKQVDRSSLLATSARNLEPAMTANSYPEITGQYFQAHFATWQAPNFCHKPLYFEEVNLERYGNELKFQNVVSAAHFFTSAALLPYKCGQIPCNCCITTLGHRRPGSCVPYQIHRAPPSAKGLILQGLITTAVSL